MKNYLILLLMSLTILSCEDVSPYRRYDVNIIVKNSTGANIKKFTMSIWDGHYGRDSIIHMPTKDFYLGSLAPNDSVVYKNLDLKVESKTGHGKVVGYVSYDGTQKVDTFNMFYFSGGVQYMFDNTTIRNELVIDSSGHIKSIWDYVK